MYIDAVILAGGKNSRIEYQEKSFLKLEEKSFLERIASQLYRFNHVFLSTNNPDVAKDATMVLVSDVHTGCGPMGGIYSAMKKCDSEWLFVVSCDIPLLTHRLADFLCSYVSIDYDAIIPVTKDGRIHPLCGIYSTSLLHILEKQILNSDYRMANLLQAIKVKYVSLTHTIYSEQLQNNVNTYEDYARLKKLIEGPPVIAFCGLKNAGKTTLLSKIIPILRDKGLNVAVIKHDGHDFEPDVSGTDSYRLRKAGATDVAVYSSSRHMVASDQTISIGALIRTFHQADLILIEGGKSGSYPKIEIIRSGAESSFDKSNVIAVCSDCVTSDERVVPQFYLNDTATIGDFVYSYATNINYPPQKTTPVYF